MKLENNKYYVGKTNNLNRRFDEHVNGYGSEWTKKYKPIEIIEVIENCDDFDEDKYTKIYMNKYGIDNVRGGSYTTLILYKEQIKFLKNEISGSTDKCYYCNKTGHFIKDCYLKTVSDNNNLFEIVQKEQFSEPKNNNMFDIFFGAIKSISNMVSEFTFKKNVCYRCGRNTHFIKDCYAKTHIDGYIID